MKNKKTIIPWIIYGVLAVLLIGSVFTSGFGVKNLIFRSPDAIAGQAVNFVNENLLAAGSVATLVESTCLKNVGLCKFKVQINGDQTFDSYVSDDGKLLFPEAIDIAEILAQQKEAAEEPTQTIEVVKRDVPEVELFIMSYCPFGLQAQKAMLPVYDLLKDKADIKIHFVNYAMHGRIELDENLRQYCIQAEEPEKFSPYLSCFVEDGDSDRCQALAKVNKSKLAACVSATDKEYKISELYADENTWIGGRYPRFDIDSGLNGKYGVQGSPTIVINDQVVNINLRSPENYKTTICQAFNSAPEECLQTLSNNVPVTDFGVGETDSSNGGQCQ